MLSEKEKQQRAKALAKEKKAKADAKAKAEKEVAKFGDLIAAIIPTENPDGSKLKNEQRIRIAATASIPPKFNLSQFKQTRETFDRHKEICQAIVRLSEEYGVPACYICYFFDKTSHKVETFNKGFKKYDEEKAINIIRMAQAYAKKAFVKPSDAMYHAFTTYYEGGYCTNADDFISRILPTLHLNQSVGFTQVCDVLGVTKHRGKK